MSFDIYAAVRDALTDGLSADPALLAEKIAAEVPAKELRGVLASVLPTFVSTRIGLYRREVLSPATEDQPRPSRKSLAARMLAPVRGIEGWQFLKDCTRDDVLALVAERRDRADRLTAMADRYEALADLMLKRKARTVADLSEDDLTAVFG